MLKMKKLLILFVALFFWGASCGVKHDRKQSETSAHNHTELGASQDDSMNLPEELNLNDGKRWEANPETTSGIKKMQEVISAYETNGDQTIVELGMRLQEELDGIINKCTMHGEAHVQLHIYLVPLIRQVKILREQATDQTQVNEMKLYLTQYFNYFE